MRTNTILAVLAVLLSAISIPTYCSEKRSFTDFESIPRLFEGFTEANVGIVVLSKPKKEDGAEAIPAASKPDDKKADREQLVLVKSDDKWVIGDGELAGVPVRENKVVNDVLDHVKEMRRDEKAVAFVNADDATRADKGVTEETGTLIRCLDAERRPLAELYLGKDASGGKWGEEVVKGFYVCRKDRKDIFLYEPKQSYWNLDLKPESWVDTKMHQFDVADVVQFHIQGPKGEVTFEREKSEGEGKNAVKKPWKMKTGPDHMGAIRQQEVDSLLSRFAYVNCQHYVGSVKNPMLAARADTSRAKYQVSANLKDGTTYRMWVMGKVADKNEYDAVFEGKDPATRGFLVAIGQWMVDQFDKDPKDLFDPPADALTKPEKVDSNKDQGGGNESKTPDAQKGAATGTPPGEKKK